MDQLYNNTVTARTGLIPQAKLLKKTKIVWFRCLYNFNHSSLIIITVKNALTTQLFQ